MGAVCGCEFSCVSVRRILMHRNGSINPNPSTGAFLCREKRRFFLRKNGRRAIINIETKTLGCMPGRFFAGRNSILQPYRYETHAQTSEGSRCSQMPAEALVRYYAARGYTGLCITDHFLNGNTTVPSCGSWESRIDQFCAGYERAAEAGAKLGLSVFFGWEFSHAGTDFLTYGLDKAWLLRHPDCHTLRVPEYSALVHESGGFLVQAHPFREDTGISRRSVCLRGMLMPSRSSTPVGQPSKMRMPTGMRRAMHCLKQREAISIGRLRSGQDFVRKRSFVRPAC